MAGLVIVVLAATVCVYRSKLRKCKTSLIRCINENIEMKEKLPESELPRFIGRDELTPEEFTSIIQNMLKRLMFVCMFVSVFFIPASAQDRGNVSTQLCSNNFSFRANLLRWATLTPDLGLEYRINKNVGILVNGSWTSWSWDDKNRRYALWEVAPEVRCYLGKDKRGYIGAMYKVGHFNYKLSETGRQGDIMGGGITGGYVLRLNNALSLDFGLGLGHIHAKYDKYVVIDGVRVKRGNGSKNWWGPVSAGVTLVWTVF